MNRFSYRLWEFLQSVQLSAKFVVPIRLGICLILFASSPLFAQTLPSPTDNVLVRTAIFITQIVFYGMGGLFLFWAVLIMVKEKVWEKGMHGQAGGWTKVGYAAGMFMVPSLLKLALDWFNNQDGTNGALDDMVTDISIGGTP